jgi:type II secretory pathway pseudopilin PulG
VAELKGHPKRTHLITDLEQDGIPVDVSHSLNSESGDTLIEVLIAVVIIALAASALLGALLTSITSSESHRSLSVDDTVLKSFAEAAKEQIEFGSSPLYTQCAAGYTLSSPPPVPAGYTVSVTSIQLFGCPAKDLGYQLITATAANAADHVSQQLQFIVRNPSYAP